MHQCGCPTRGRGVAQQAHALAYVSIRQHTCADAPHADEVWHSKRMLSHTSAYVSIPVRMPHTRTRSGTASACSCLAMSMRAVIISVSAYVSIHQHTSAYASACCRLAMSMRAVIISVSATEGMLDLLALIVQKHSIYLLY
jgi:hypothetical protein